MPKPLVKLDDGKDIENENNKSKNNSTLNKILNKKISVKPNFQNITFDLNDAVNTFFDIDPLEGSENILQDDIPLPINELKSHIELKEEDPMDQRSTSTILHHKHNKKIDGNYKSNIHNHSLVKNNNKPNSQLNVNNIINVNQDSSLQNSLMSMNQEVPAILISPSKTFNNHIGIENTALINHNTPSILKSSHLSAPSISSQINNETSINTENNIDASKELNNELNDHKKFVRFPEINLSTEPIETNTKKSSVKASQLNSQLSIVDDSYLSAPSSHSRSISFDSNVKFEKEIPETRSSSDDFDINLESSKILNLDLNPAFGKKSEIPKHIKFNSQLPSERKSTRLKNLLHIPQSKSQLTFPKSQITKSKSTDFHRILRNEKLEKKLADFIYDKEEESKDNDSDDSEDTLKEDPKETLTLRESRSSIHPESAINQIPLNVLLSISKSHSKLNLSELSDKYYNHQTIESPLVAINSISNISHIASDKSINNLIPSSSEELPNANSIETIGNEQASQQPIEISSIDLENLKSIKVIHQIKYRLDIAIQNNSITNILLMKGSSASVKNKLFEEECPPEIRKRLKQLLIQKRNLILHKNNEEYLATKENVYKDFNSKIKEEVTVSTVESLKGEVLNIWSTFLKNCNQILAMSASEIDPHIESKIQFHRRLYWILNIVIVSLMLLPFFLITIISVLIIILLRNSLRDLFTLIFIPGFLFIIGIFLVLACITCFFSKFVPYLYIKALLKRMEKKKFDKLIDILNEANEKYFFEADIIVTLQFEERVNLKNNFKSLKNSKTNNKHGVYKHGVIPKLVFMILMDEKKDINEIRKSLNSNSEKNQNSRDSKLIREDEFYTQEFEDAQTLEEEDVVYEDSDNSEKETKDKKNSSFLSEMQETIKGLQDSFLKRISSKGNSIDKHDTHSSISSKRSSLNFERNSLKPENEEISEKKLNITLNENMDDNITENEQKYISHTGYFGENTSNENDIHEYGKYDSNKEFIHSHYIDHSDSSEYSMPANTLDFPIIKIDSPYTNSEISSHSFEKNSNFT